MNKLLSANMWRLKKSKIFWGCLAVVLAFSVWAMCLGCHAAVMNGREETLDSNLFKVVPFLGLILAPFAAVFLGVEYGEGTLRNKLIVGHTREHIYFANLTACGVVSLLLAALDLVGGFAAGVPQIGPWQGGAGQLLSQILVYAGIAVALAAFFTMIGMLSTRRATTMAICLFGYLLLLVMGSYLYNNLLKPEMTSEIRMTANGLEVGDPFPNPSYIGGTLRTIYQFLMILLPTGQAIQMANGEFGPALPQVALSLGVAAVCTAIGLGLFKRKDIK